jgi:hypothetical protein
MVDGLYGIKKDMRTRKEIEKNINKGVTGSGRYATEDYEMFAIEAEILLDIRDLLQEKEGE